MELKPYYDINTINDVGGISIRIRVPVDKNEYVFRVDPQRGTMTPPDTVCEVNASAYRNNDNRRY